MSNKPLIILRTAIACVMALMLAVSQARAADEKPVRLFILSGQSNMAGLDPKISFTPTINQAFADSDNVIIKSAQGGQPIRRWYKQWKGPDGKVTEGNGDLYDKLLAAVKQAMEGKPAPESIVFVWMQGEADSKTTAAADQYKEAFQGLLDQLRTDLGGKDVHYLIGRLSDFGNGDKTRPGWETVRKAQVELGEAKLGAWVDTDDLNDKAGKNDLHYTRDGYKTLGERFAQKAIELISKPKED